MKRPVLLIGALLLTGCGGTPSGSPSAPVYDGGAPIGPRDNDGNGGATAACLRADDVLNIPPGNAAGTTWSGYYVIVSGFMQSCQECSRNTIVNPCADFPLIVEEGTVVTVSQDNGVVIFESGTDTVTGAVNEDGTFILGTIAPALDNNGQTVGQGLVRFEGRFTDDRILADATMRMTANETSGLVDIQFVNVVTYQRTE